MNKSVKGYKAMNKDMTCLKFKFKVGKTYETESLQICKTGFHFCENVFDVYNYYDKSSDTIVCEVEALGEIQKEGDKSVTNKIKIIKQLSDKELLEVWIKRTNSGYWNSGYGNFGNRNSGYGNFGNRNSGDWNSGDGNSGYFNTSVPLYFFNKPSDTKYTDKLANKIRSLNVKPIVQWIGESLMTNEEKNNNPSYKVTGGFLRKTDRFDWSQLTDSDKDFIKSLPNFDDSIFKIISNGVSLSDDVEVTVNGKVKIISKAKAKELGFID